MGEYSHLSKFVRTTVTKAYLFSPSGACVAHWYERKRAAMVGLVVGGSSIGAVVFPVALNKLLPLLGSPNVSILSFHCNKLRGTDAVGRTQTVRIVACISFTLLVPALFMVKSRLPRSSYHGWRTLIDGSILRDTPFIIFLVGSMAFQLGGKCLATFAVSR